MEQGTKFENNYLSKVSKIQIFDFLIKAYVSEILQVKKPPKPLPHPGFKHLLYDKRFCLGWVIVAGTIMATKSFLNLIIKIIDLINKTFFRTLNVSNFLSHPLIYFTGLPKNTKRLSLVIDLLLRGFSLLPLICEERL